MASRSKRPFGGALGGTFGTLLQTTLSQVEHLKDSATRAAKGQREQLATQLIERKRTAKLAALGARVMMLREAEDLAAADPDIAAIMDEIAELDETLAARREPTAKTTPPVAEDKRNPRVWRPVMPDDEEDAKDLQSYMVDGDVPEK